MGKPSILLLLLAKIFRSEGKKLNQYVLIKTLGKGSYSKVKVV